jgi:hypothetical protein
MIFGNELPDISKFANMVGHRLTAALNSLVHLGPLREHPERHYIFSGNEVAEVGKSGKLAPDLLFTQPHLLKAINEWLKRFDVGYALKVRRIGSISSGVYALRLIEGGTGVDVSSADVGFGMSQVLPVLAQSIFSKKSLLVIEQPELHLHPRLQAELGSFFAGCCAAPQPNQFLIETHSEHLLLRLQALIRRDELSPEDVSVVFLEKDKEGQVQATPIALDEGGRFADPWPGGFFPERLKELR